MQLEIRSAVPGDYAEFARLFAQLGVEDPAPDRAMFEQVAETVAFACANGAVIGYCFFRIAGDRAHVCNLVVDREARSGGVGRALLDHAARRAMASGCRTWSLNVKQRNAPAQHLYRKFGFRSDYETAVLRFDWAALAAASPARGGCRIARLPAGETGDAALEGDLGLEAGRLARVRKLRDGIARISVTDGRPTGLVVFRPGFPAATGLRARTAAEALYLLQSLIRYREPIADAQRPWRETQLQVMIERQPQIVAGLVAAGAERYFVLDFMEGPLPYPRMVPTEPANMPMCGAVV